MAEKKIVNALCRVNNQPLINRTLAKSNPKPKHFFLSFVCVFLFVCLFVVCIVFEAIEKILRSTLNPWKIIHQNRMILSLLLLCRSMNVCCLAISLFAFPLETMFIPLEFSFSVRSRLCRSVGRVYHSIECQLINRKSMRI